MASCASARCITLKVKADMSGVPAKVKRIKSNQGLGSELAMAAANGMNKFVPMRSGALASSVRTEPFKVTYNTPYARRMFNGEGFSFSTDQHPLARAQWHQGYIDAGGDKELGKTGTEYLRGK